MKNEIFRTESIDQIKEAIDYLYQFAPVIEVVIAAKALEKQIPMKPIGRHTNYKCRSCGRRVRSGNGSSSTVRDNFCQRCGQAIDWGEGTRYEATV